MKNLVVVLLTATMALISGCSVFTKANPACEEIVRIEISPWVYWITDISHSDSAAKGECVMLVKAATTVYPTGDIYTISFSVKAKVTQYANGDYTYVSHKEEVDRAYTPGSIPTLDDVLA